jgi:hypothetical protein
MLVEPVVALVWSTIDTETVLLARAAATALGGQQTGHE